MPIDPKSLGSKELNQLVTDLYAIHEQIFDGVTRQQFMRYVVTPPSLQTHIRFFLNAAREKVGYITFQVFEPEIQAEGVVKKPLIYRTEVGILPAYRGNNATLRILIWECFKSYFKFGRRESFFLATPIHPNPYCLAARQMYEMYPHPNRKTPQNVVQVLEKLSEALGLESRSEENVFLKKVGWIVRNRPMNKKKCHGTSNEFAQFYLQQNPNYAKGDGLMMLIPFRWMNLYWVMGNVFKRMISKRVSVA